MSERTRVAETAPAYVAEPSVGLLEDLVERIIRAAKPERIVLFGSAAHGRMRPDSDLDVLVVKSGDYRRLDVMHAIRQELRGFAAAVDLVVATPEELARYGNSHALVYRSALSEGRELYAV